MTVFKNFKLQYELSFTFYNYLLPFNLSVLFLVLTVNSFSKTSISAGNDFKICGLCNSIMDFSVSF